MYIAYIFCLPSQSCPDKFRFSVDGMDFQQLDFRRWVHILALVYWLGGEWGVFQTSYHVTNSSLSLEERKTAHVNRLSHRYPRAHGYRLSVPARSAYGPYLSFSSDTGRGRDHPDVGFFPTWLGMTWAAFIKRETDIDIRITRKEELLRYPLIAGIVLLSIMAYMGQGPVDVAPGTVYFRALAAGPDAAIQAKLGKEIAQARIAAYMYWITISRICFLEATKPF
jgi:hypothetical protein